MYYAICKYSRILFRFPMGASDEQLSYALACAKDSQGAGVVLEIHTPSPSGLITEIIAD